MVTGREIDDLATVLTRFDLFDHIVAENGALIFRPATREEFALGTAPPPEFVALLRSRGVERISVGRCIVTRTRDHRADLHVAGRRVVRAGPASNAGPARR